MAKDQSLDDLEAELAKMDAELASMQSKAPAPKEKTSFLKRRKETAPEPSEAPPAPAAEPAPEPPAEAAPAEPKAGLFSKLKRKKEPTEPPAAAAPEAPPAEAAEKPSRLAAFSRFGRKKAEPAAEPQPAPLVPAEPAPAPVAAAPIVVARVDAPPPPPPVVAERIPPPTGTWVQEGKSWRRVAGGPPLIAPEALPAPSAPLPFEAPPDDAPPPERNRRLLFLLIPLGLLLLVGVVFAASSLLGPGDDATAATATPPANVTTPKGDLKAAFTLSPVRATSSYKANEAIRFEAGGVVPAGETATYEWDFGDGSKGSGKSVSHVYRNAGTYNATLKMTAAGSTASISKTIKIVPPPTAQLAATKGGGALGAVFTGEALSFSGAGSTGTGTVTYAWDFGDGASATGETADHAFSRAGRFTVTLTVTDGNAVPATRTKTILVGLRMPLSGSAPASTTGATTVPFTFDAAPGFLMPVRIKANITYAATVGTGGAIGGLPGGLPVGGGPGVDDLVLVLKDAQGNVIGNATGSNGAATIEITQFDPATLGGWILEVQRPQGPGTADKPFSGLLEVELAPNA